MNPLRKTQILPGRSQTQQMIPNENHQQQQDQCITNKRKRNEITYYEDEATLRKDSTSEWDDDTSIDTHTHCEKSHVNVVYDRTFIDEENTYDFDEFRNECHPYPFKISDGIYIGNVTHGSVVKFKDESMVHFNTIITLHERLEEETLNSSVQNIIEQAKNLARTSRSTSFANVSMPMNRGLLHEHHRVTMFQNVMETITMMQKSKKPILVRCLNGGSRTVACIVADKMLKDAIHFSDAYKWLKGLMNNMAPLNIEYEKLLVEDFYWHIERTLCTTFDLVPLYNFLKVNKI